MIKFDSKSSWLEEKKLVFQKIYHKKKQEEGKNVFSLM